jgi:hypothetical protein
MKTSKRHSAGEEAWVASSEPQFDAHTVMSFGWRRTSKLETY